MTDEVVTRLYRALVEELRRRGHVEERPIKVSALYQTLIPYRTVRSALGVELNADYEHALLRLLSGERGLLRLEPADAREELRREVDAPYPFVGLFRKFSASNVWVSMPEVEAGAAPAPGASAHAEASSSDVPEDGAPDIDAPDDAAEPIPAPSSAPTAGEPSTVRLRSGGGAEPAPARPAVHLHASPDAGQPERQVGAAAACAFCDADLPSGRRVRFCPHCGGDQRLQPCPRCEAVLERDWRYCISCGREVSGG